MSYIYLYHTSSESGLAGPRAVETVDLSLNGDVHSAVSHLWDTAMGSDSEGRTNEDLLRSRILWGLMNSIEPANVTRSNMTKLSSFGEHEALEIREQKVDSVKTATTVTRRDGGSPGQRVALETRTVTNSNRSLSVKAGSVAARIKNDFYRVVGLLECAHRSRKWVCAVVTSLTASGIGPGTRQKWTESIRSRGSVSNKAIPELIRNLEATLKMWVGIDDEIAETDGKSVIPAGLLDGEREVMGVEEKEGTFVSTLGSLRFGSLLVSRNVCAICAFRELAGIPNGDSNNTGRRL